MHRQTETNKQANEANETQLEAMKSLLDTCSVNEWAKGLEELLDLLISALKYFDGEQFEVSLFHVRTLQKFFGSLKI